MVRTRAAVRLQKHLPSQQDTEDGSAATTEHSSNEVNAAANVSSAGKRIRNRNELLRYRTTGVPPTPVVAPVAPMPTVAPLILPRIMNSGTGYQSSTSGVQRVPAFDIVRQHQPYERLDAMSMGRQQELYPQPNNMQYLYEACKVAGGNYPVHPDVRFRKLPFYQLVSEIMKPSTLVANSPNTRMHEGTYYFHLTPQQAHEIMSSPEVNAVQIQLRFCLLETSCEQEDCFPPSCAVKVNNRVCQLPMPIPTNKSGVEPKRPPVPVNITSLLKLSPTVANMLTINWSSWSKTTFDCHQYALSVSHVKKLTSAQLLARLKNKGTKHSDYTRSLIKEKLREDLDCEIATTSLRVSLMCPLGQLRMVVPCRPTTCEHLQCFDASLFLQMNEMKSTWHCPVCDKPALYDTLVVDGYFQDVLNSSSLAKDCKEIQLHKDGSWTPHIKKDIVQEEVLNETQPNIEVIQDDVDIDVIPLSDGSDSSTDMPSLKRTAVASYSNPDVPIPIPSSNSTCVDLTSDSEDDLPLKRRVVNPLEQPSFSAEPAQPDLAMSKDFGELIDNMLMYSSGSQQANLDVAVSSIISLDSPSPPCTPSTPSPQCSPRSTPIMIPSPSTERCASPGITFVTSQSDNSPQPQVSHEISPQSPLENPLSPNAEKPLSPIPEKPPSPYVEKSSTNVDRPSSRADVMAESCPTVELPNGPIAEASGPPHAIVAPFQPDPDPLFSQEEVSTVSDAVSLENNGIPD